MMIKFFKNKIFLSSILFLVFFVLFLTKYSFSNNSLNNDLNSYEHTSLNTNLSTKNKNNFQFTNKQATTNFFKQSEGIFQDDQINSSYEANNNDLFLGTNSNGLFKSTNNGSSWTKITTIPIDEQSDHIFQIIQLSNNNIWVTAGNNSINDTNLYSTNDYGASWTKISYTSTDNKALHDIYETTDNEIIGGYDFGIYYTNDFGQTWHSTNIEGTLNVRIISIIEINGILLLGSLTNGLWYNTNGDEKTFTQSDWSLGYNINFFKLISDTQLWIGATNVHGENSLFETTNLSTPYEQGSQINGFSDNERINFVDLTPDNLFWFGTSKNLYYSYDEKTFNNIKFENNHSYTNFFISTNLADSSNFSILLGTNNAGLWTWAPNFTIEPTPKSKFFDATKDEEYNFNGYVYDKGFSISIRNKNISEIKINDITITNPQALPPIIDFPNNEYPGIGGKYVISITYADGGPTNETFNLWIKNNINWSINDFTTDPDKFYLQNDEIYLKNDTTETPYEFIYSFGDIALEPTINMNFSDTFIDYGASYYGVLNSTTNPLNNLKKETITEGEPLKLSTQTSNEAVYVVYLQDVLGNSKIFIIQVGGTQIDGKLTTSRPDIVSVQSKNVAEIVAIILGILLIISILSIFLLVYFYKFKKSKKILK